MKKGKGRKPLQLAITFSPPVFIQNAQDPKMIPKDAAFTNESYDKLVVSGKRFQHFISTSQISSEPI